MSVPYRLEPHDIRELKTRAKRTTPNRHVNRDVIRIIEEFVESGYDCCRVCFCDTDRQAHIECTILRRSVKLGNYDNVKVVLRKSEVYLVKKDKWEEGR